MWSWRESRRTRLRRRPFPPAWLPLVEKNLPLYRRLPPADQAELLGHVQVFLAEKYFEGAGGLEISDVIRVTIAAHACLLVLHRPPDYYPQLVSIIVYPRAYVADREVRDDFGIVTENEEVRLGESWREGALVLSWDDVEAAASGSDGCHNVVLHEFAHQLDLEDGTIEGSPALGEAGRYRSWAETMEEEFNHLQDAASRGRETFLDEYGATHPAEFFAVVTEYFFTCSASLRGKHPRLYQQLVSYYRQDPASLPQASS